MTSGNASRISTGNSRGAALTWTGAALGFLAVSLMCLPPLSNALNGAVAHPMAALILLIAGWTLAFPVVSLSLAAQRRLALASPFTAQQQTLSATEVTTLLERAPAAEHHPRTDSTVVTASNQVLGMLATMLVIQASFALLLPLPLGLYPLMAIFGMPAFLGVGALLASSTMPYLMGSVRVEPGRLIVERTFAGPRMIVVNSNSRFRILEVSFPTSLLIVETSVSKGLLRLAMTPDQAALIFSSLSCGERDA